MRPLELVGAMVLDNGARWGEQATDDQWADMRALLEPDGGSRRHFWLRARGRSKTFDAGAATMAVMLAGDIRPGDEMFAAAAGREQAGLLANKILAITSNTPELAGAAEIQQFRVITPRTGAVLQVMSSELAGSWGKTPRWLFGDEVCNHDNTEPKEAFLDSLITALVKRPDSVCLLGSTPSSVTHWAWKIWQHALASQLWRASITSGPAPWQDPRELEDERMRLADFMWRRLFECEWAAADDALADEHLLAECTRDGILDPEPGLEYVVTFDLGLRQDHSAVAVAHAGERDGLRMVIVDRLYGWVAPKGGQVDLGDVLDTAEKLSRDFSGAKLVGDIWQAAARVQEMQAAGYRVTEPQLTASANSRRAQMLTRLLSDRALSLPPDENLRKEFLSLRLAEGVTPGIVRLTTDGSSKGHFDRVTAVMYAADELVHRPGQSWRNFAGDTRECGNPDCGRWYTSRSGMCPWCAAPNPQVQSAVRLPPRPYAPQPGSYAAAFMPPGARRCDRGHIYSGQHGDDCPRCAGSSGRASSSLPAAFAAALAIGRR